MHSPKCAHIHAQTYEILIAFPHQRWFRESDGVAYLVCFKISGDGWDCTQDR
jgi:hypothetical protein